MSRKTGLKEKKKKNLTKTIAGSANLPNQLIKGVCGQTQLFRELCLSSTKKYLHHIFSKQSLQMQQRSRNVSG